MKHSGGAPRKKIDDLRIDRFVFKLSENQINTLKGKTNAHRYLRTLNKLFIKAMKNKDISDIQQFIENMLNNI